MTAIRVGFAGGTTVIDKAIQAVTRILRAGGLCICPDSLADDVTPVMLYEDLVKCRGGVLL